MEEDGVETPPVTPPTEGEQPSLPPLEEEKDLSSEEGLPIGEAVIGESFVIN